MIDPRLRRALSFLETLLKSPAARGLAHLRPVIPRLRKERFSIRFEPLEEDGESAHFDLAARELVVDDGARGLPAEMTACLLAHEVQHAYDDFNRRPYTLESELRAFKAEAVFLAAVGPERLARKIGDAHSWRWFGYLYETRMNLLSSELDFESGAARQFCKTQLGDARFEGLQTIPKLLLDMREALAHKEDQLRRAARRDDPAADAERRRILRADIDAGRRLVEALESERRRNLKLRLPLD